MTPSRFGRLMRKQMQAIVSLEDADAYADSFARRVRLDGVERPNVRVAAARAGYRLFRAPAGVTWREPAQWARVGKERRIYLSPWLDDSRSAHPIAHECGHCLIDELKLRVEGDVERWCHRFASALLCPATAARREWRRCSGALPTFLQRWNHVPNTAVALRVHEAVGLPTFVFVDGAPRYPTKEAPDVVRAAARAARSAAFRNEGLQAVPLPREPGRVAVILELDEAA